MIPSLLATKLYLPEPSQDLIARPRLEAGLRKRLTLVSARAGFGKTSLAAGWLGQLTGRRADGQPADGLPGICWLSLDEGDNLPAGFWMYFIAALQTVQPGVGEAAWAALSAPGGQPPPLESALVSLLNDLAGLSRPLVLALDDYHAITHPEIHRMLDFLLLRQPRALHLLILTREDPPLALSRLRARGELVEIRAADLQFSETESSEFLNEAMRLGLDPAEVSALAQRTEGWIAGLRLAALSLQEEGDRAGFIRAFAASHCFLTDYLVDEVLGRLEAGLSAFLRRTSILHRFCPALCDALLGEAGSQATLRRLEQLNLSQVPLDNQRRWYRYHHLFAEFLRLRLYEAEAELAPELYRRAMEWCQQQALKREAIGYALKAKDFERAAAGLSNSEIGADARLWPAGRAEPVGGFAGEVAAALWRAALLGRADHQSRIQPADGDPLMGRRESRACMQVTRFDPSSSHK